MGKLLVLEIGDKVKDIQYRIEEQGLEYHLKELQSQINDSDEIVNSSDPVYLCDEQAILVSSYSKSMKKNIHHYALMIPDKRICFATEEDYNNRIITEFIVEDGYKERLEEIVNTKIDDEFLYQSAKNDDVIVSENRKKI